MAAGADETPQPAVKVTIRKRSDGPAKAGSQDDSVVFAAKFDHVKKSLGTFLKFWLMGGCGDAEGWAGIGELEAQHSPSGTTASILVNVDEATVPLISPSAASLSVWDTRKTSTGPDVLFK